LSDHEGLQIGDELFAIDGVRLRFTSDAVRAIGVFWLLLSEPMPDIF